MQVILQKNLNWIAYGQRTEAILPKYSVNFCKIMRFLRFYKKSTKLKHLERESQM